MTEKHLPIQWRNFTVEVDSGSLSTDLWAYLNSASGDAMLAEMKDLQAVLKQLAIAEKQLGHDEPSVRSAEGEGL